MQPAENNDARRSLDAAVDSVNFLIFEQFVMFILTAATLGPSGNPFGLFVMLAIPFGTPAFIYGVCCNALKRERVWAAITLLTLVSLHAIAFALVVIGMLAHDPFTWPALGFILATIPMLLAAALLARAIRNFNRLPSRQPHGFQVVLPMESDREK